MSQCQWVVPFLVASISHIPLQLFIRSKAHECPRVRSTSYLCMQHLVRKKYSPPLLVFAKLRLSRSTHSMDIPANWGWQHEITVPGPTENSALSSATPRGPGHHHITSLPSWKYKIVLLVRSFISYLEKILKLILRRIFIFNNFPQLLMGWYTLSLIYTRLIFCKIIIFKGKMLSHLYFKNMLYKNVEMSLCQISFWPTLVIDAPATLRGHNYQACCFLARTM